MRQISPDQKCTSCPATSEKKMLSSPGDEIIVAVKGTFGERMVDIVRRLGGKPIIVEQERGKIIEPDQIKKTLDESNAKAVAMIHAETSTGVLQPLDEIGNMVRKHSSLFIVDTVTSLGQDIDTWVMAHNQLSCCQL